MVIYNICYIAPARLLQYKLFCFFFRHGIVFDIFSDADEDDLDPIEARDINFLYNKAARGEKYTRKSSVNEKGMQFQFIICTMNTFYKYCHWIFFCKPYRVTK